MRAGSILSRLASPPEVSGPRDLSVRGLEPRSRGERGAHRRPPGGSGAAPRRSPPASGARGARAHMAAVSGTGPGAGWAGAGAGAGRAVPGSCRGGSAAVLWDLLALSWGSPARLLLSAGCFALRGVPQWRFLLPRRVSLPG